jgi:hypothetical protein
MLQTKAMIEKSNELAIIPKLPLSIGDHCIVIRAGCE